MLLIWEQAWARTQRPPGSLIWPVEGAVGKLAGSGTGILLVPGRSSLQWGLGCEYREPKMRRFSGGDRAG